MMLKNWYVAINKWLSEVSVSDWYIYIKSLKKNSSVQLILIVTCGFLFYKIVTTTAHAAFTRQYVKEDVFEKILYGDDTILFKCDYNNKFYAFYGRDYDSLKNAFQRAEKMAKYCEGHKLEKDYIRTLIGINGVTITFNYEGDPWNYSSIILDKPDRWHYGHIILMRQDSFMDYLTKYKKICKKLEKKKNKDMEVLNKYANELDII